MECVSCICDFSTNKKEKREIDHVFRLFFFSLQPLSMRAVSSPALTEGPLDEPIASVAQPQQHRHSSSNGHRKEIEAKNSGKKLFGPFQRKP